MDQHREMKHDLAPALIAWRHVASGLEVTNTSRAKMIERVSGQIAYLNASGLLKDASSAVIRQLLIVLNVQLKSATTSSLSKYRQHKLEAERKCEDEMFRGATFPVPDDFGWTSRTVQLEGGSPLSPIVLRKWLRQRKVYWREKRGGRSTYEKIFSAWRGRKRRRIEENASSPDEALAEEGDASRPRTRRSVAILPPDHVNLPIDPDRSSTLSRECRPRSIHRLDASEPPNYFRMCGGVKNMRLLCETIAEHLSTHSDHGYENEAPGVIDWHRIARNIQAKVDREKSKWTPSFSRAVWQFLSLHSGRTALDAGD